MSSYLEYCQETFNIPGLVQVVDGINGQPAVLMRHPNGSEAELYLHGANVVSWRKGDGTEILYLRPDNAFDGVSPILCAFQADIEVLMLWAPLLVSCGPSGL